MSTVFGAFTLSDCLLGKALINPGNGKNTPTLIAYCLALAVRIFEKTARRGASLVLKITKLFGYSFATLGGPLTLEQQATLSTIPESIQTLEGHFNLNIDCVPYAICPKCNCTYAPQYPNGAKEPVYPSICTDRRATLEDPCGEPLLSKRKKPFKVFEYYPFWDWFGRFIALPGIEDFGDQFCAEVSAHEQVPLDKHNAADGRLVHDLLAADGKRFIADRGPEGRWVFILNADFFNVEGNRIRGPSSYTGMLAVTCLNLPLHLRNDHAFIYIPGLIPSHRHEPKSRESENRHYLKPLIDDLLISYTRGLRPYASYKTQSSGVPYPRVHKHALLGAPMDLKAARPFGGFREVTSHLFCFVCKVWHQAHLGRTDYQNWEKIDDDFLRTGAQRWRDCQYVNDRKVPEDFFGTRYSEFWRLPYWRPTRQLIVDPMHTMYLILTQRYFREILDLDNPDSQTHTPSKPSVLVAFYYPFRPPPHLSSLPVPGQQGPVPLRKGASLNALITFEKLPAEQTRLGILDWTDLLPDYLEARLQRLQTLQRRVIHDVVAFGGIMRALLILSEKAPEMERQQKTLYNQLHNLKWDALRYVCENLALYPDPTSAESLWKNVAVNTKQVTKKDMVNMLVDWVGPLSIVITNV